MNEKITAEEFRQSLDRSLSFLRADPGLARRVMKEEKGEIKVKKISGFTVAVAVFLMLTMATTLAATVAGWGKGLDARLQVTDETKQVYRETELIDQPLLTVTQNGVAVTLEESVADTNCAYIAFRVHGFELPDKMRPAFESVFLEVDGKSGDVGYWANFWNMTVTGPDGRDYGADGSLIEDFSRISFVDENGDLIYIMNVQAFDEDVSLPGRTIRVSLDTLGLYRYEGGVHQKAVDGVWTFEWQLKGTDRHLDLEGLAVPIGKTGSVLKALHLSPLHIRMLMNVPRNPVPENPMEDNAPYFRGVKYKDGTVYDLLDNGGAAGYESQDSETYGQFWLLDRVIDPEQVESLLFASALDDTDPSLINVKVN